MVNLGLTREPDSCPILFARLGFALPAGEDTRGPLLRSWPVQQDRIWELFFPLQQDQDHAAWARDLAACLKGLGQSRWCVDTHGLVQIFNLPLEKSLSRWGELFWPHFRMDSVFVFATGNDDHMVREVLESWHRRETNICLRRHYDFTLQEINDPALDTPQKIKWSLFRRGLWNRLGLKSSY
ncbi:hypothetical protein Dthio_PD2477 [Desulfonatronospira thiodismutans ASO3-1]|uniref:Uncharacterized protein n=2 Tax=Desulfonatronospira TaxID=488937 RepID=D6SQQ7_9BACT|nr:hypothetical protein [Desulfonatronospira thiodismutans]EFI35083.1 hypothetical protein Dthio_PD2477 [Desulfonatronospira thiodismutans ASO3-1]